MSLGFENPKKQALSETPSSIVPIYISRFIWNLQRCNDISLALSQLKNYVDKDYRVMMLFLNLGFNKDTGIFQNQLTHDFVNLNLLELFPEIKIPLKEDQLEPLETLIQQTQAIWQQYQEPNQLELSFDAKNESQFLHDENDELRSDLAKIFYDNGLNMYSSAQELGFTSPIKQEHQGNLFNTSFSFTPNEA